MQFLMTKSKNVVIRMFMNIVGRVTVSNWRTSQLKFTGVFWIVCVLALSLEASLNCSKCGNYLQLQLLTSNLLKCMYLSCLICCLIHELSSSVLLQSEKDYKQIDLNSTSCSVPQRRRQRDTVSQSNDRVYQRQAERPKAQ